MSIPISEVKRLRETTGAGIKDCKQALESTNGDFEAATRMLKEKGLATVAKKQGRSTDEGRIFIIAKEGVVGVLELGCETDFVARNERFVEAGEGILERAIEKNLDAESDELRTLVEEAIARIKENIVLKRLQLVPVAYSEHVATYLHGETAGTGSIVKLTADKPEALSVEAVKKLAYDLTLHVAAMKPLFLSLDRVSESYKAEMESLFAAQVRSANEEETDESKKKPDHLIPNIVKGKLKKHFQDICLLDQGFVKDDKKSVAEVLADVGKAAGAKVEISDFLVYTVGGE